MAYRFRRKPGVKYNNTKVTCDGHTFDSKHEYNRYCELKLLEKGKVISNLELQKKFVLIPAQYAPDEVVTLKSGKQKIVKGRCLERECAYFCDFSYTEVESGKKIVEDCKSPITRTAVYKVKKKLMLERYGIIVQEI